MICDKAVSRAVLEIPLVTIVVILPVSDQSYLLQGTKLCFLNALDLLKRAI